MEDSIKKFLEKQTNSTRLAIIISAVGLLLFITTSSTLLFKDKLFSLLFPKPASQAVGPNDWAQVQKDPQRSGFSIEQINPPYVLKWKWNTEQTNPVRFSNKTGPIVAFGKMFIGGLNGQMYAVDIETGQTLWSFQGGGPITHSAAADESKVIFGSGDGKVYGLSESNGAKVWEYSAGAGFDAAPLLVNGTVYIGSKDGNFYGLDLANGSLKWKYSVGIPIYNSASYSQTADVVIFGAEDMHVYALGVNGTLKWKSAKLTGKSFRDYWPVISDIKGVVILRTMPSHYFGIALGRGDDLLKTINGGTCPVDTPDDPAKRVVEQTAIKTYLTDNPYQKTFFVLDLLTGTEKFTAPVLYTGGASVAGSPPVVDADGNAVLIWRSCYSTFDNSGMVKYYTDLGKLDLVTNVVVPYLKTYSTSRFRLIGDEESVLSLGGTNLFVSNVEALGAHNIFNNSGYGVILEGGESGFNAGLDIPLFIFDQSVDPIFSSQSPGGHVAPESAPAIISNSLIIWKSDADAIAALTGQIIGGPTAAPTAIPVATSTPTPAPSPTPSAAPIATPLLSPSPTTTPTFTNTNL